MAVAAPNQQFLLHENLQQSELIVQIHVPFTKTKHTTVINVDENWNSMNVIQTTLTWLDAGGVALNSLDPYDYTLRFQCPDDVGIPELAGEYVTSETITELPKMVLEKADHFKAREELVQSERAPFSANGFKEMEAREAEVTNYVKRQLKLQTHKQFREQQWKEFQRKRADLDATREENINKKNAIRQQKEEEVFQRCADREAARLAKMEEKKKFVLRKCRGKEAPIQPPVDTLSKIVGKLDAAISEANVMEEHLERILTEQYLEETKVNREKEELIQSRQKERLLKSKQPAARSDVGE